MGFFIVVEANESDGSKFICMKFGVGKLSFGFFFRAETVRSYLNNWCLSNVLLKNAY